jgi:hypothetical protein
MKRQDRKRCDARSAGAAPLRTLDAAARPCRALRAIRSAVDRGAPMTRLLLLLMLLLPLLLLFLLRNRDRMAVTAVCRRRLKY